MQGDYSKNRLMLLLLKQIAKQEQVALRSFSDEWIIELQKGESIHRVIGYRFDINDSVAAGIARDKVASYVLLHAHSIPAVRHELIRTAVTETNDSVIKAWDRIVLKPLLGNSGRDVHLFDTADSVTKFVKSSPILAWAASPFLDIQTETRLIMIDGEVALAYDKTAVVMDNLKMFNLGLGGTAKDVTPTPAMTELARAAQKALKLRLCSVDIVRNVNGELSVLEVNDAITMEHYGRQSHANRERVYEAYRSIIKAIFT